MMCFQKYRKSSGGGIQELDSCNQLIILCL